MGILERINSSDDIKKLTYTELEALCAEIREFIVDNVSRTGGHLASNLGAVELTVALNRVYDSMNDRILFDVGHQCYTQKIITGRKDGFLTLRQLGGLAGFPRPYESYADPFTAGHSSDSVSVALGMAKARTITGGHYDVVAVIGDGSLTGGLAYEGLENAAASKEPLVIILNDNGMSINRNVGGISKMLQKLRIQPGYVDFKRRYRDFVGISSAFYKFTHNVKENVKNRIFPDNLFSELGLFYLGPVDGHNVRELEAAVSWAREAEKPVLLHVVTQKGKGVPYAEERPEKYHGVGPFNKTTGEVSPEPRAFCDEMGECLCSLAQDDGRIVAVTAAMSSGTGLSEFAARFPKRFFDVGIAEGHAVSMAAGMAKQGLVPVFAVYSTFLQRGYDMLIHDAALDGNHVVFCVDRAGIVGRDGETHQGVFDIAFLTSVPGMTIFAPSSFAELREMLRMAIYETQGPVAVRYPRGGETGWSGCLCEKETVLFEGSDLTVVAYGTGIGAALELRERCMSEGISIEVIKLGVISPNDFPKTLESLRKTRRFLIAEDVCSAGCVGGRILSCAAGAGLVLRSSVVRNLGNGIVAQGSQPELFRQYGLDGESLFSECRALFEKTEKK